MVKTAQNFTIYSNSDYTINFNASGTNALTGCAIRWILQDEVKSTCWLYNASTSNNLTISGCDVYVTVQASLISNLNGVYYHELKLLTSGSVAVLSTGLATIKKSSGG